MFLLFFFSPFFFFLLLLLFSSSSFFLPNPSIFLLPPPHLQFCFFFSLFPLLLQYFSSIFCYSYCPFFLLFFLFLIRLFLFFPPLFFSVFLSPLCHRLVGVIKKSIFYLFTFPNLHLLWTVLGPGMCQRFLVN